MKRIRNSILTLTQPSLFHSNSNMFTETGNLYIFKFISQAHRYFTFPLVSQPKNPLGSKFSVENSGRYKRGALGILLLDGGTFLLSVLFVYTVQIWKKEFHVSYRLLIIFLTISTVLSVFMDLHSLLKKDDLAKLLNFGQVFYNSFTGKGFPLRFHVLKLIQ